jgi:two-component system NtrC family sensor kinase
MPVQGTDTLSWLGREFNTMADTMTSLLQDVRNQRERLETVINSIDDGIVVLDVERKVVAANEAYLRRRVQSRDEVLGAACHDAGSGTCGADDCPTLACLELGERQVRLCERTNIDGETVLEEIHASPIRNPSGTVVHVVEVWRDISERRAAEARLAESHRLASLGMLASGFSHELNTPLATILVCVEGIQRSIKASEATEMIDSHRIAENASIAREQLLRCRGITQHFLRLSRGQDSSVNLVNLEPTCVAVARLIEPTARERSVTVRLGPFHEELHVRTNEAELQHVLLNLMLNAIQACEQGGTVNLGAHGGDPIRIHVADDGCGISPGDLKRVFDPFFSGRRGGTGLGLFFSMDFVRHWGGSIDVKSVPGSGSTFAVLLPAAGTADDPVDVQ